MVRERGFFGVLFVGEHSNVVDEHLVRELRIVYFESGPVPAHGDIQDKEERLVERIRTAGVVLDGNLVVLEIVYIHRDDFLIPSEFVCMELRDVDSFFGSVEIARVVAVAGVLAVIGPVVGPVDNALVVDGFDDVDFTAGGPGNLVDVFAEHPERGPYSLACR